MRIGIDAHFVGVRHGGNEHHFGNVIRALALLPDQRERYFLFNYEGAGEKALPGDPMKVVPLHKRSVYLQRGLEIPRLARSLSLDVLHVPFNVLPVGKSKKILTIHDLAFLHVGGTFDFLERKRMSVMTRFSAKRADHIFAVSEFSKRDIMRRYGIEERKITVTYNAVNAEEFAPWSGDRKKKFLAQRGIDFPFLLFVGTLQPRKNVANLLKAFAALPARAKDVHLVLVGRKGWIYEDIFRFIRERGLEKRVHHFEHVDQDSLAGFYNTALGLVFPSIFEGFGMPILEAMSCGCPVASADVTSMPEVYGDAALPFHPADTGEMASRMEQLISDDGLRRGLVEKGFRNCARFSWSATAEEVRKVYRSL